MKPQLQKIALIIFLLLGLMIPSLASDLEQQAAFAAPKLVVNTSFLNVRTGPGVEYPVLVTVVGGTELPVLAMYGDQVWYQVNTDGGPGWVNVEFTLARGSFTNVPVVRASDLPALLGQGGGGGAAAAAGAGRAATTRRFTGVNFNEAADLRTAPSFEALVVRSAYTEPGVIYPLLDRVEDEKKTPWYLVNIPSIGTVWTDRVQFSLLECGNDNIGVIRYETPIRFEGIAARQNFLLNPGTELYQLGFEGPYMRVELADGTIGLVDSGAIERRTNVRSACETIPAAFASASGVGALGQGGGGTGGTPPSGITGNRAIVNTGNLNIRSGPSADFSIVTTVRGGTELAVAGRTRDGVWFYVTGSFGDGWLNSQFVLFRGNYASIPVIAPDSLPALGVGGAAGLGQGGGGGIASGRQVTGVIFTEAADLRNAPSFNALVLRSAYTNETMVFPLVNTTRDANNVTWYQVNVKDVGMVWTDRAINFALLECGNDNVGVTIAPTFLRFDGISTRPAIPLSVGTEVYRQGFRDTFTIVELGDGTTGLIDTGALAARTNRQSFCEGVSLARAATGTGGSGTAQAAAITGNRIIVNTSYLNVRSGPSARFMPVATVPGGTQLAVIGRAKDGVWLLVTGDFGEGWVNSEFVIFRGNYASVPVVEF